MQNAELLAQANTALTSAPAGSIDLNEVLPIRGGLSEGYEGKIKAVGYIMTTLPLTGSQTLVGGVVLAGNTPEAIEAARTARTGGDASLWDKLNFAASLAVQFEDNSSVAISVLRRSAKTTIAGKPARATSFDEMKALVGKTFKVDAIVTDASVNQTRQVPTPDNKAYQPRVSEGRAYTISVA